MIVSACLKKITLLKFSFSHNRYLDLKNSVHIHMEKFKIFVKSVL
jgi:hypothetical protein